MDVLKTAGVSPDEGLSGFEWLRVESMRLMEENAAPDHGICGNEWFVIEQLREAEESGRTIALLDALRSCECPDVARMAETLSEAA